jgi:micrococcal nuclease
MYEYKCTLLRVIDGDTLDVLVDLGFNVFKKIRIRLHGIDAFESRTRDLEEKKKGLAAKERLIELLEGKIIRIKSIEIGKFGRAICIVYVTDRYNNKININHTLLTEGHAIKRVY